MTDDMVIRPRLRKERTVRSRAAEAKRTDQARQRMFHMERRSARRFRLRRRKQQAASGGMMKNLKRAAGYAGRMASVVGWVTEGVIGAGQMARRLQGMSGRLIEAQDMHTMYGDLRLRVQATSSVRNQLESDREILRIIGMEGRVNSQILNMAETMREQEMLRVRGADLIERSQEFDSPDSLLDKGFAEASAEWKATMVPKIKELVAKLREYGIYTGGPR